jgi:heme exporter protein B
LGSIGFASVGTVLSAIAGHTRLGEVLLPVLFFPIVVPLLIAAVETTAAALGAGETSPFWLRLMVSYDVIFLVVSFLVFGALLEE